MYCIMSFVFAIHSLSLLTPQKIITFSHDQVDLYSGAAIFSKINADKTSSFY